MFREYQEKGDEDYNASPSTLIRTISGTNRETEASGRHQHLEIKEAGTSACDVGNGNIEHSTESRSDNEEQNNSEMNEAKQAEGEYDPKPPDLNQTPCLELPLQAEGRKQSSDVLSKMTEATQEEEKVAAVDVTPSAPSVDGEVLESPEILEKVTPEVEEEEDFVDLKEESNLPFPSEECGPQTYEELASQEMLATQQQTVTLKEPIAIETKDAEASVETEHELGTLPEISPPEKNDAMTEPNSNAVEKLDEENTDHSQTKKPVADAVQPHASETLGASEKKIAKLDVSSVASDTERLELKSSASLEANNPVRPEVIFFYHLCWFI